MTSIAGYTDLLLGESVGILGAMQRQFLQRVKANIARMDGMLTDLVQITAIDTGQIKLEAASIDVPELIKDAVMAASTLFRDREQSIRLELAEHSAPAAYRSRKPAADTAASAIQCGLVLAQQRRSRRARASTG